jgi:hypothetical protein
LLWLMMSFWFNVLLVLSFIQQVIQLFDVGEFEFDHPAITHRRLIDDSWFSSEDLIDFYDFSAHRCINITCCLNFLSKVLLERYLYTFNGNDGSILIEFGWYLWKIHIHNIS